jgi:uncharacterized membrane protein
MSDERDGKKFISHHILPTSSNLLGLCFVLLSFMKVTKTGLETVIDELVAVAVVLFLAASIFSYASIRTASDRSDIYEKIADIIFLSGLGLLTVTAVIIVFEII